MRLGEIGRYGICTAWPTFCCATPCIQKTDEAPFLCPCFVDAELGSAGEQLRDIQDDVASLKTNVQTEVKIPTAVDAGTN